MKIADIGGTFQHHVPLAMLFCYHSDLSLNIELCSLDSSSFFGCVAATSRVIFLDVDGVILPAGLNLSRFNTACKVEHVEEEVLVLMPS